MKMRLNARKIYAGTSNVEAIYEGLIMNDYVTDQKGLGYFRSTIRTEIIFFISLNTKTVEKTKKTKVKQVVKHGLRPIMLN